jgi:hypothetical protein
VSYWRGQTPARRWKQKRRSAEFALRSAGLGYSLSLEMHAEGFAVVIDEDDRNVIQSQQVDIQTANDQ